MDEGRAPVPFRTWPWHWHRVVVVVVVRLSAAARTSRARGEKTVGNSGGDEIAVRFVHHEGELVRPREAREGRDQARGIYGTRLGDDINKRRVRRSYL